MSILLLVRFLIVLYNHTISHFASMKSLIKKIREFRIYLQRRYTPFFTNYLGFKCKALDKLGFLFMADEIFHREVYKFNSNKEKPYIIDCGANIGLSVIYFKKLYPHAEIIAFEPYNIAIDAFKFNTKNLDNILLIEKGLSSKSAKVEFYPEGSDGSRIAIAGDINTYKITTEKLSPYLNRSVEFLKIDIEGSEMDVIRECRNSLKNIESMYIEYHSLESKHDELDELLSIVKEAGFSFYIEAGGIRSKSPFMKIESRLGYKMLVSIFCYR